MADLVIIATIEFEPGLREQAISILKRHQERCLQDEPGTLAFEVLIPEKSQNQILL
jgi:(4S)-4-hydroxy-5-phosphonooxypentane-2,3-dione isomerase